MSEDEVFIDEDTIAKIAAVCRGVSYDQIRQAVYINLTKRHGCRRVGKAVKPPISKDMAWKIIKLYKEFTKSLKGQEQDEVWESVKERLAKEMRVKARRERKARREAQKLADCKALIRLMLENHGNQFVLRCMEMYPEAYEAYDHLLLYCELEDMDPRKALNFFKCDAESLTELVDEMTTYKKPKDWIAKTTARLLASKLPSERELKRRDFMRRYGPFHCPKGHLISRYGIRIIGVLNQHQQVDLTDKLVCCITCGVLYIVACPRCGFPMRASVPPNDRLKLLIVQQYQCSRCGTSWEKHEGQRWPQGTTKPINMKGLGMEIMVIRL